MTAKEYLSQAYYLDQRINSKIEQIASLNELARKATVTISDMPGNPNRGKSAMASAVEKIIDLEAEINAEVEKLVDLKVEGHLCGIRMEFKVDTCPAWKGIGGTG